MSIIQCPRDDEEFGVRGQVRAFRGRDMSRRPKRRRAAAVQSGEMCGSRPGLQPRRDQAWAR